jgi:hypothetical protein
MTTVKMTEHEIQQRVLMRLNSRRGVRVFRNNIGMGFSGTEFIDREKLFNALQHVMRLLLKFPEKTIAGILYKCGIIILSKPRRIRFGLHPGSGDLIGWKSITISPEMVGKKIAILTSVEVKSSHGRLSEDQKNWIEQVTVAGGIARMVKTTDEADEI